MISWRTARHGACTIARLEVRNVTRQISRYSCLAALCALLVTSVVAPAPAHAEGRRASMATRVRARLVRIRSGIGRRLHGAKTWLQTDANRRKIARGALLVGGGMIAGAAMSNPAGALAVVKVAATAAPSLIVGGAIGSLVVNGVEETRQLARDIGSGVKRGLRRLWRVDPPAKQTEPKEPSQR